MSLKLLISGFLILFISTLGYSQDCVPDQSIKQSGFYPKTIEDALIDKPYKQVLQIRVFKDTVVVLAGNPTLATIDSINVDDIIGLPSGFYYTCSRKNCSFIPDSTGCATLKGNPTSSQIGYYPLGVAIEVFAKVFGSIRTTQRDTIDQFTIVVTDGSSTADIAFRLPNEVCYPNPSKTGVFKINQLFFNEIVQITCYNTLGKSVPVKYTASGFEINGVDGLYYVAFTNKVGNQIIQKIQLVR